MAYTTYRKFAELLNDTYYRGKASDDANFSLRYWAEWIAVEVAQCAVDDAILNSNLEEATYANDGFINVFKNLDIINDGYEKVVVLPSTPPAMPKGAEIMSVRIEGNICQDCIPMKGYQSFSQSLIGIPCGMTLFKREGNRLILVSDNALLSGKVTVKMVGGIGGDNLLSSDLQIPKNYEKKIWDAFLDRVMKWKGVQQDLLNDSVSNPA